MYDEARQKTDIFIKPVVKMMTMGVGDFYLFNVFEKLPANGGTCHAFLLNGHTQVRHYRHSVIPPGRHRACSGGNGRRVYFRYIEDVNSEPSSIGRAVMPSPSEPSARPARTRFTPPVETSTENTACLSRLTQDKACRRTFRRPEPCGRGSGG